MPTWTESECETFFADGTVSRTESCQVRIGGGRIVVDAGGAHGGWMYAGEELSPGHFHLTSPALRGTGSLHQFEGSHVLDGWWREASAYGMWRISLRRPEDDEEAGATPGLEDGAVVHRRHVAAGLAEVARTLDGQTVVIIGGSSGIGLATARLTLARGGRPVIVGRDAAKLDAATHSLGPGVGSAVVDASGRAALDALFARVEGGVDHLVLAASGGRGAGAFADLAPEGLRAGFEAKFWEHWHAAQAVLPVLAPAGSITLITAASSRLAYPGTSGLAAINGALERMVPTLARELAPRRVNAVSPGVIDTPWWADKPAEMFKNASQRAPLGRAGQADEVADAVLFLVANAFVTGVVLDVDGGLHLT